MTEKEELEQELANDAYYEGRRDAVLRNDYDEFCEQFAFEIEEATQAIRRLKEAHEKYGWDFSCKDWI